MMFQQKGASNMKKLSIAPKYDCIDMTDLATLAHEQIDWLSTGLADIRKEILSVKSELTNRDSDNQYKFAVLEKKAEIFEYLAEDFKVIFDKEIAKYTAEIEEDSEGQA